MESHSGRRRTVRPHLSAKEKQDESIMGTNNSCIVSKRSVEKIYHKKDDGFLRHFVKKFQRRSPLINRGYWLRMRAIESVVRQFLEEPSCSKVVVNLGCGYDPLPFNFLAHEGALCVNTTFIDVDYEQLIRKKCEIIKNTTNLQKVLDNLVDNSSAEIPLSSTRYTAVACNLEDIQKLQTIISSLVNTSSSAFLFIAEVSLTYVDATAAERVLAWTSTLPNARFCLLEQFLPDGPSHPFAKTMLKHFEKLNSPLKSALRFPSLQNQTQRFVKAGWPNISAVSLWQLWADDQFLHAAERQALDHVEPFDEWEEFALFASHYFLLTARTLLAASKPKASQEQHPTLMTMHPRAPETTFIFEYTPYSGGRGHRRFGAGTLVENHKIIHHGGHGTRGRLRDYDCFHPLGTQDKPQNQSVAFSVPLSQHEVMCHTLSRLGNGKCLLVGGRASPESGFATCLNGSQTGWKEVQKLPHDLYRHCAVSISSIRGNGQSHAVLIFGGKSGSGKVRNDWLYWTDADGWRTLEVVGGRPCPRFGASMSTMGTSHTKGLLTGGLAHDGKALNDVWMWELIHYPAVEVQCIDVTEKLVYDNALERESISRFGASMVATSDGVYLVGGVSGSILLGTTNEIVHVNDNLKVTNVALTVSGPRPLLIGCAVEAVTAETFVVVGGGGVCFSFGTCWNEGSYTARISGSEMNTPLWSIQSPQEEKLRDHGQKQAMSLQDVENDKLPGSKALTLQAHSTTSELMIRSEELPNVGGFPTIVEKGCATLLTGLSIGSCISMWTNEYLKERIGKERAVVVHAANSPTMNFLAKDFSYKTMPFGEFLDQAEAGGNIYLRSLSASRPADQVTNLSEDYPAIAGDFEIPQELDYVKQRMHSMPLRISGPVAMWLHYDVMANVLCQIKGNKRLVIFPPSDVCLLDFPAGASSSRISIFDGSGQANFPGSTRPMIFDMKPGDILYIPALWPHTAQPTSGLSIAVNVFFRSLDGGYAAGKDVYGNRDVQAYENGRRDLQKINKAFSQLPMDMSWFYMKRLAAELSEMAEKREAGQG